VTADRRLVDAVEAAFSRSARRDWARFEPRDSASIGRQEIFTRAGDVHGYELFYRPGGADRSRVDRWPASQQDIATSRVLGAARTGLGAAPSGVDRPLFVNFTRSFYSHWNGDLLDQILDHFALPRRRRSSKGD